jgi:hypothetical protein
MEHHPRSKQQITSVRFLPEAFVHQQVTLLQRCSQQRRRPQGVRDPLAGEQRDDARCVPRQRLQRERATAAWLLVIRLVGQAHPRSVQVWPWAGAVGIRLPAAPADALERAVAQHEPWSVLPYGPGGSALSPTPAWIARRYWLMYIL